MTQISPRLYQSECITTICSEWERGINRQLVCLPTGTGKTIIFALLAKKLNLKTLIIAHRQELIEQAFEKIKKVWFDSDVGIVKAQRNEINGQVVIASVQTICRKKRLKQIASQNFQLMIIDEAHHAVAQTYKDIVEKLGFLESNTSKLLIGVTATPNRTDNAGLIEIFESCVYQKSINEMIHSKYLCDIQGKQIITSIGLNSIKMGITKNIITEEKDFDINKLAKKINTEKRNKQVVDSFVRHVSNRKKSLVFCVNVLHCKDLAQMFSQHGFSCSEIHGNMKPTQRKKILDDFHANKYQVLTNCMILTEGFDCPDIDCIVMARPTCSPSLYLQMLGRGTRIHENKKDCFVLDFTDNSDKYNLCSFENVLGEKLVCKEEEEEEEKEKQRGRVVPFIREEEMEKVREYGFKVINFKEEKAPWRQLSPTENQLKALRNFKHPIYPYLTRGLASDIISGLIEKIQSRSSKSGY